MTNLCPGNRGRYIQLNDIGMELAEIPGVHAMTDVTGFGLLGHLLEVCRASRLAARLTESRLPVLETAGRFARDGLSTGAQARNWASYGAEVDLPRALPAWRQALLSDPQTSGGLLVSCAPAEAEAVLRLFHDRGYAAAAIIGAMAKGSPRIFVS